MLHECLPRCEQHLVTTAPQAPVVMGPGDSPGWAMHTPSWASDRPTASRCSVVGFVTPPHRAAAGGPPEAKDGRGGPGRALGGKVSVYTLCRDRPCAQYLSV